MFEKLTSGLDFHGKALTLRAERQRVIASNIANADTPGYAARDLNFNQAMADAMDSTSPTSTPANLARQATAQGLTHPRHLPLPKDVGGDGGLGYVMRSQPSADTNTVDLDQERSNFVDNAVRYESTLRFINGHSRTILSAITGQ